MNQKLFSKVFIAVLLLLCHKGFGQVIFSEDWSSSSFTTNGWTFPSGQANWTVGAAYTPTGGTSPNAYFNWFPNIFNYSNELVSPVINATAYSGGSVFLSYKLQLNNFGAGTVEQFAIEYKTISSPSWFLLTNYSNAGLGGTVLNWNPTNVVLPGMAGQQFQIRFRAYGPNSWWINGWGVDDINVLALNPCSGTPNAGTAVATPNNPCPADCVTLSLNGASIAGGLTYQWQVSSPPFTAWSNIGTSNPLIYCPAAGTTTEYRCIVTCTANGFTATSGVSSPVVVQSFSPTSTCYCTPTALGGACITNVTFGSLNNTTTGCTGAPTYYNMYTTPVPNFTAGAPVTFSMTTDVSSITSMWIDYNHDMAFSPSEWQQIYTSGTSGSVTFNIPFSAISGQTRMRVRSRLVGNLNGSADACTAFGSGETEDYIINISPAGPYDPTVASITAPTGNSCPDSNQTLTATVYNYGSTNISTFLHPVSVLFKVYGPAGLDTHTVTIGGTLGSPTLLAAGGSPPLTFTWNNVNMFMGGTYHINAIVSCPGVTNASLSNDSLANAVIVTNYRPQAGPDYQLCQYRTIPFGQGLTVSGCSVPLYDSVTITFNITGPCVDNIGATGTGTSTGLPANCADQYACNFANGIIPTTVPAGATFYTPGILSITNMYTAVSASYASEVRMNLFHGSGPTGGNVYDGGASGNTATGSANFTYQRNVPTSALSAMFTPGTGTGPGSTVNLGYWESYNDSPTASDAGINAGGTPSVAKLKIYYSYLPPTFSWYDVPTGGSSLYSLSPFNPLAYPNAVVNNSNTPGTYKFYAACLGLANCRVPVKLKINPTPSAYQDTMWACEYAVGANSAIFNLPTQNSAVSGGLYPATSVAYYGDQSLLTSVTTPATDTSSSSIIYSKVYYAATGCYSSDTLDLIVNSYPQFTLPVYTGFACAPNSIDISSLISIFPPTGIDTTFYHNSSYTIPYTGNPHAISVADTLYMITHTTNGAVCGDSAVAYIDVIPASNNIANQDPLNFSICGSVGCGNITLNNGNTETLFTTSDCKKIAKVTDDPTDPVNLGVTTICEDIDCGVPIYNGQPYVNRSYQIEPTNDGKATVCLYYLQQDFDDYNAAAFPSWPYMDPYTNLTVSEVHNGPIGNPLSTVTVIPNSAMTVTYDATATVWEVCFHVDSFSYFYAHTANPLGAALPVSLLSFTGKKSNETTLLNWVTSNEINNQYFIVERSANGRDYKAISSHIPTQAVNGNSQVNLAYTYTDESPMTGHNYYRLRQVDLDNHIHYSGTLDVLFGQDNLVSVYPNPVTDNLNIAIQSAQNAKATVRIIDATGKTVHTTEFAIHTGTNETQVAMQNLADGIYLVRVDSEAGIHFSQTVHKK